MRLALILALALAGCSGAKEALNEVELDKAAKQLADDSNEAVNRQINAIDATRNRAEDAEPAPEAQDGNQT
jgi:uncharacterized lipoprotein YmbA